MTLPNMHNTHSKHSRETSIITMCYNGEAIFSCIFLSTCMSFKTIEIY